MHIGDQGKLHEHEHDERNDAKCARAAVLHDLELTHALPPREDAVRRIHKSVRMDAARQKNRQDEDQHTRQRPHPEKIDEHPRRKHVAQAEHEPHQREKPRTAPKVLRRPRRLSDKTNPCEKLKANQKRMHRTDP